MSINYQRRNFLRGAFYCGLALGLPKPVLAALNTTQEAAKQQIAARYFRWKYTAVRSAPTFKFYSPGDPIGGHRPGTHVVRTPQVSDDGHVWRDAEPYEISDVVEGVRVEDDA